jgi:hypothetical protein
MAAKNEKIHFSRHLGFFEKLFLAQKIGSANKCERNIKKENSKCNNQKSDFVRHLGLIHLI